jgi:hypothetical protein
MHALKDGALFSHSSVVSKIEVWEISCNETCVLTKLLHFLCNFPCENRVKLVIACPVTKTFS